MPGTPSHTPGMGEARPMPESANAPLLTTPVTGIPLAAPRSRRAILTQIWTIPLGSVVLAACGPNLLGDEPEIPDAALDPSQVIYATWGSVRNRQKQDWTLQSFQNNYDNLTVNLLWAATVSEFIRRIHGLLASGTPPDLLHLPAWSAPTFYAEQVVSSLDAFMRRDGFRPEHLTPPFDACTYQRSWYALPRGNNGLYVVFYNRTQFTTAGVPVPTAAWTWDAFLHAAQQLTQPARGNTPQRWGTTLDGLNDAYQPWLWANGGDELERRNSRPALHEPAAVDALQWLADLHLKHGVAPAPGELPNDGLAAFASGRVAMWFGPAEAELELTEAAVEFDWGIAPQPRRQPVAYGLYLPNVVSILSASVRADDAWELAQFLVDLDTQRQEWEHLLWHPQAPSLLQEDSYQQSPDPPHDRRAAIPGAILRPRTPIMLPRMDEVRAAARADLADLWTGQRTAIEVAAAIVQKLDAIR